MDLLEREQHLLDLRSWQAQAARDGGLVVLASGEAGIGKTTLLQEFLRGRGAAPALWGACDALHTPRPLAPLHDIALQTRGRLLELMESEATRGTLLAAVLDRLSAAPAPVVVFEDLHWADEATLDLLKFLGRRIHRTHALLVLTYRDDEVGARHPLKAVIGDLPRDGIRRLQLGPLSAGAVERLAARARRPARGLHRITGGNPFFVTEILATHSDNVPMNVRDAVLARATRLAPEAREIAELACIVPGRTEIRLLQQVAGGEAGIEGCLEIGMRMDAEFLAFRHELARRALEDSLAPGRRRDLHRRVLAALKLWPGVSPARLAHHADGAQLAAEVLESAPAAAAKAAGVGAHREAVSLYELALRYAHDLAPRPRAELLDALSVEHYLTGQEDKAADARREAIGLWSGLNERRRQGDGLRWLSRFVWMLGRRAAAERHASEAIAVLEGTAGPELAMAYSTRAQLDMLNNHHHPAIEWAHRAIALAEPAGYDEVLCHALNSLGMSRLEGGEEGGWSDLQRSLSLALARDLQDHAARAYANMIYGHLWRRDYAAASGVLGEGLAYCEDWDLDLYGRYFLATRARLQFERGRWQEAVGDLEAALNHPDVAPVTRIIALTLIGQLRLRRGEPDAGTPLTEAQELADATQELQRLGPLAIANAEGAWIRGDDRDILRHVRPAYELALRQRHPWVLGGLTIWLWRAGARAAAVPGLARPYVLEMAGDVCGAADAWAALECPFECAMALASGGEPEMLRSLGILQRLGLGAAADGLRRRMQARGMRRIPRGPREATRSHVHGLTPRESEILALMADGLRNADIAARLYLSTRTVDHHVSAILGKLGAASRAQAVAALARNAHRGADRAEADAGR